MTRWMEPKYNFSTAEQCLLLNYHADHLEPHIDCKGPKRSERAKPQRCASLLRVLLMSTKVTYI